MKCLLCGSRKNKFIFNFKGKDIYLEKLKSEDFRLKWFKCEICGVYFSRQNEGIDSIYADKNLYDAQFDSESIRARFNKIMGLKKGASDNLCRVKRIKDFYSAYLKTIRHKKRPFKILDFGAGTGVFLARFLDKDYKGYALEINRVAAKHIKQELNIKVYTNPISKLKSLPKFDIVTMNKVLEHIEDPLAILGSIKDILSNDGIIYVELPDTLNFKYYGEKSEAFTSGHYMVFNSESLFYLSKKSGLEILKINRIIEPSGKITIYSFLTRKDNAIL